MLIHFGSWMAKGEMYISNEAKKKSGALPLVVQISGDEEENIVMVDRKAAAGYLQGQSDPDYIAKLPSFRLPGFYGKTFRAFEIIGDSMLLEFILVICWLVVT